MTNSTKCCEKPTFCRCIAHGGICQNCGFDRWKVPVAPDKESGIHPLTGLLVKAKDVAFEEPTESDVVARFREKFAPRAQEFRGSRGYIVMNDIESFILGEIQAAREEERAAWAEREYKLLRDIERLVVERDALRTDLTN